MIERCVIQDGSDIDALRLIVLFLLARDPRSSELEPRINELISVIHMPSFVLCIVVR